MAHRYNLLVLVSLLTLLLLVGISAMAPLANAQYLWLDTNGDGLNWSRESEVGNNNAEPDCLHEGVTSVDVYLATDLNPDGTPATCALGGAFTINSYQVILRGSSGLIFNGWSDGMGFSTPFITVGDGTFAVAGTDAWVGRAGEAKPPGTYKLGTLSVTITGSPALFIAQSTTVSYDAVTGFGSDCSGSYVPGMLLLGGDLPGSNAYGTCFRTPVLPVTWGKIKQRYR